VDPNVTTDESVISFKCHMTTEKEEERVRETRRQKLSLANGGCGSGGGGECSIGGGGNARGQSNLMGGWTIRKKKKPLALTVISLCPD